MKCPIYTDRDALKTNVARCELTIKSFEAAIEEQQKSIGNLKRHLVLLDLWEKYNTEKPQ